MVQQERLKGHRAEEGTSRKGMELDIPAACPKVLNKARSFRVTKEKRSEKKIGVQKDGKRCIPQARRQGEEYIRILKRFKASIIPQKADTFNQRIKANQWKRPGESGKKGETSRNEKPLAILMVQPWDRVAKQKITQTFSPESVISFPPLREEDETEGLMISEAEMEGHFVHRMYVDEGSSSEILYEHCFNRFCSEVRSRTISATTPLVGFSEEIIWPLGQISLLVKIGDEEYSTSAWMNFMIPADMIGVPRHIAKHRLNIREGCLPVKQKKKGQAPERNKAIYKEVKKLVDAGIIKEVHYHNWLSNPVIVKKHDGGQRMCVDFKYLNKACPKDGYPLSEIDWKVESLCGNKLAGTWKYMDDLVIKIRTKQEVIRDIEETFKTLREINMKLNLKKCTFGMREGMFLGYKVNADGLKVCPNKVEAVLSLSYPKCLKYVQRLNGKLASLNRFMSKSAEKSLPFFKTLKKCTKKSDFQWNAEAKMAFKQMKTLIAELPMLTALKGKEELVIYLVAAKESISAVLMTKRDGKQTPIYFVSHFIVERPEDDPPDTPIEDKEELPDPCILFTDRSSCIDGSGAGLIITSLEEMKFAYALRFRFNATNNDAEYEALIVGLRVAKQMGVKNLQANVDSRLVANQRRAQKTDALSKMASTSFAHLRKQVLVEEIKEKSINEREVLAVVEEDRRTWMTPIYDYLTEEFFQKKRGRLRFERNMQHARRSKIRGGQIFKIRNRTPITSSWPFYKWGIDIAGPFPEGPVEIGMPTLRTTKVDMIKNDEALEINLDLLEEKIEHAAIQEAKSKAMMEKYCNARVRNTSFKPGDLVYRSNEASYAEEGGKLGPKWEGPYEVTKALGKGAYKLRDFNRSILPRTWNVYNLKKCYVHEM
nr:retrotransposon protein, putative, Ty3-gypsy subclass [Tanacetum cinerariifolium]